MALVVGVDSSTQSTKVEAREVDTGQVVATGTAKHPATSPPMSEQDPRAWWEALARQYHAEGVEFASSPPSGARLPRSLFDSVADNLMRNALAKRAADESVRVRVSLDCGERITLRVCDSGAPVPPELAATLLRAPVSSRNGLGIGLYQAARLAESSGYRLDLESNRQGAVCFALIQGSTPADTIRP